MERVKLWDENGLGAHKSGVGLFTAELLHQMPWLPIEEEGRLTDPVLRENFVERVFALYELNMLWRQGLTRGGLIAFHSRYKLSLLAHSQPEYRELGRFVADIERWESLDAFAVEYRQRLMRLLQHKATRLIDHYRQGMQPLLAPITLLKHYMAEYPDSYLAQQRYFEPYPEALRLRYGH
jgi:uncharacterized protein YbgA (DUF1722 family)